MKNYIRFLALFLCLVIVFAGVFTASADSADTEAPVIRNITIENHTAHKEYGPDDTLRVSVDVTDNIQVEFIQLRVQSDSNGEIFFYQWYTLTSENGFVIEVPINNMPSGEYYINVVEVKDSAQNSAVREIYANEEYYCFNVNNQSYTTGTPRVSNVKVTPTKGSSKTTTFTYTATVEPGGSAAITKVEIYVGTKNVNEYCYTMTPTKKKNEYSFSILFGHHLLTEVRYISISQIVVSTADNNHFVFYPKEPGRDNPWELYIDGLSVNDARVELTDIIEDTDSPELKSYKYKKSELVTPDELSVQITAYDKSTEPYTAQAVIKKEGDPNFYKTATNSDEGTGEKTKVLTIDFDFPKYGGTGTFYISEIRITDKSGNNSIYSLEKGNLKKQTFTVKDVVTADYFTSVTAPDLLSIVSKAANEKGKTVIINVTEKNPTVPKAVFEAIAGKDVTVVFEKMYSYSSSDGFADEGFEWVMQGKHVDKSKAKDINAYFYIEEDYDRSFIEAKKKNHKNPLPEAFGKNKGETLEQAMKRKLTEIGWEDLIRDIEHLKEKNERFEDAYVRITDGKKYIKLVFADNGQLPGKATIMFKPSFAMRKWTNDYDMRLYYINEKTGEFELVQSNIKTEKSGYYHLNIFHNSEYAFMSESFEEALTKAPTAEREPDNSGENSESTDQESTDTETDTADDITTDEAPKKKSNALTVILIVLGVVVLIVGGAFGFFYYKKKTAKIEADSQSETE